MQKGGLQKVHWHLADGHEPKHTQQMLMEFVLNITPCAYNNPVKLLIKVALHKTGNDRSKRLQEFNPE